MKKLTNNEVLRKLNSLPLKAWRCEGTYWQFSVKVGEYEVILEKRDQSYCDHWIIKISGFDVFFGDSGSSRGKIFKLFEKISTHFRKRDQEAEKKRDLRLKKTEAKKIRGLKRAFTL